MSGFCGGTSNIPFIGTFCLAGSHNVLAWFSFKVEALVPITGNILNELEGIHLFLIVLNDVCSHLKRTVERNVKCKLAGERRTYLAGILGNPFAKVHNEDAGSVVHRSANATCKRKNGGMIHRIATKTFVFRTTGTFVANPVWPCTADTGGTCGLMGIYHYMMFGRFLNSI